MEIRQGVLLLFFSILFLYFIYINFKNSNIKYCLFGIVLLGFILRLFVVLDPFLHDWDEKYHALVAKNLIQNFLNPCLYQHPILDYDYRNWTENHVWLHKLPLALWLISISLQVFGMNEFGLRFPSLILSTVSIILTYRIATSLYNAQIGLIAAFLQAISGFLIETASGRIVADHIDTALVFFIELTVYLILLDSRILKNGLKLLLIGLSTSLCILCKWLVGLFPMAIFICHYYNNKNIKYFFSNLSIVAFVAIAFSLPWYWVSFVNNPDEFLWEQLYNFRHLNEAIEGHGNDSWYFISKARINWNEGVYVAFLWFFYYLFVNRKKSDWILFIWVAIPYFIFYFSHTKLQGFVLFCGPAIFIIISIFCVNINTKNVYNINVQKFVFTTIIIFASRYCIERIKPFDRQKLGRERKETIFKLKKILNQDRKTIVFGFAFPIDAMFYLDCICYNRMPSKIELSKIDFVKFNVIVIKDSVVPEYIIAENKVLIKSLE
jgi:4-amino-4-deoxy-L-arabinose transferase-like glycosyltransferase